jgi:hypothetical protein
MGISGPRFGLVMRVSHMKQLIFATAIVAAISGAACVPSQAADFGLVGPGARHVRTTSHYWNWRDRCAWAGYYCLYAYDGYIYHYPFDDRLSAYGYRRHHRRHT